MVNSLKTNEEVLKESSCPVESLKDPWNFLSLEVLCVLRSKSLQSCLTLWTPWTAARQVPLSMEFSRQEYWSGLPHPPPGNLLDPGIKPSFGEILLEELINALINCITIFGVSESLEWYMGTFTLHDLEVLFCPWEKLAADSTHPSFCFPKPELKSSYPGVRRGKGCQEFLIKVLVAQRCRSPRGTEEGWSLAWGLPRGTGFPAQAHRPGNPWAQTARLPKKPEMSWDARTVPIFWTY